jgi:Uma2 family endonuclease
MAIAPEKLKKVPERLLAALHRLGMPPEAIQQTYDLDDMMLARALSRAPERLTIADLDYLPRDGYHYELREGELVRMSPSKRRHSGSAGILVMHLGAYLLGHPLGEISIAEGGFVAGPQESLCCPDIAYVSRERATTVPPDEYYPFGPDIAVEVWSPDNSEQEMSEKATGYLAHGGRLVWILRPQDKTVRVYRPNSPVQTLRVGDTLTGEDVLPGFSVAVSLLFL